jgi:hypothetical protein
MASTLRAVRIWTVLFVIALALSGITAFPLRTELTIGADLVHSLGIGAVLPDFVVWIDRVRDAVVESGDRYPFLAYGTDWLAFAHLVIALAFIGVLRDPVRNRWVVRWAMIACVAVIPTVLIAGAVRGIPWGWQLIDMSFGIVGIVPLLIVDRLIGRLERERSEPAGPDEGADARSGEGAGSVGAQAAG